jgi:hypothetical protein
MPEARPPLGVPLAAQLDTSTELLLDRLGGIDDDEYRWSPGPGALTVRPRADAVAGQLHGAGDWVMDWPRPEPVPPPLRTIAWLVSHTGAGCLLRHDWTIGTHALDDDDITFPHTAAAGLEFLRNALARWREVFDLPDDELLQVGRSQFPHGLDPGLPLLDILWWQTREVIHHGAEMAFLRDLYASRS